MSADEATFTNKVAGCVLLYLACTLASAGGVGGGGLNVPLLLVVFRLPYQSAVILSLCTVLGNYVSQVSINWRKRHPFDVTRPLIYWDAVLILLPAQLGGSNIGVLVAKVMPEGLLVLVAMLVLIYAGTKTFLKGLHVYRKESESIKNHTMSMSLLKEEADDEAALLAANPLNATLLSKAGATPWLRGRSLDGLATGRAVSREGNSIFTSNVILEGLDGLPPMVVPWTSLRVLGLVWLVYAAIYVTMQSFVACSPGYWGLLVSTYPPLMATVIWGVWYVSGKQRRHPSSIVEGDLIFAHFSVFPPILAFGIGILSSLLGIGGGELMGPLLLSLNVLPQVSAASTSMMSLLNSSSNIVHYAIIGEIDVKWFFITFCIGVVGGVTGRMWALYMTKNFGRISVMVFCLATVLFISFWLLVFHLATEKTNFSIFTEYCSTK